MERGCLFCLLLALIPATASGDGSPTGMSYYETKDVRVVYYDPLAYAVPHVVRTFTNSLAFHRRLFGWTPSEKPTVLLQDVTDFGSATAITAPRNAIWVEVSPLSHAFETFPASERMYLLMNHEVAHLAQADVAAEEDRRWRRFFGGKVLAESQYPESFLYSYLTTPRFTTPRWWMEGSAVFMETWMGGGLGRAQGGYDEMVFRAMVQDNAYFYDPLGLASRGIMVDFQVGANAYLYGTRFITWLAYAYSPEKVIAWTRRDEGSERYYSDRFQQVFGLSLERAWQDWIAFEHEFQRKNLAEVRKFPITPHRKLVSGALGSVSRTYYDESKGILYAGIKSPGVVDYVGALDTRDGTIRHLTDIRRAMLYRVTSLAYDPAGGTVFFTNNNFGYPSWRHLMAVDVRTGEERTLIENSRVGEIVFNPADRSLLGVQHHNGLANLVHIPHPYTEARVVHTFPWEVVPSDLDISPDGRLLSASVSEWNGDQFVRVWELQKVLAGDVRPVSEFRFGQSVPESFVFSKDGRYLYGSSYYTGVSNIFRYEVATGKVDAVSNAESGFFRPVPLSDGKLLVLTYTSEGFVPATIDPRPIEDVSAVRFLGAEVAEKHPVVKSWQVSPPGTAAVDEPQVTDKGAWDPLRQLSLTNAFPVLQGYKNSLGIGYHFNIEDPLSFARFGVTAAFTPDSDLPGEERGHVELTGNYRDWRAALSWNRSDFYDLFGPTKRSRKGYAAKLGHDWKIISDEPRKFTASLDLAYYDKIDTLPYAQNVETGFTRLVTAEAGLHYSHVRRSLGAVDDEKGFRWAAVYYGSRVSGELTPQVRAEFDFGMVLPWAHSSIWLRTAAGTANGERTSTVANFYFGGFGNNYVDDKSVKRYREYSSFPGFGINEISALSFVRELVEVNPPPFVFESVGTPNFHLSWLRPSLFVAGLRSDPGNSALRKDYASAGAQLDLRFSMLHWYDMTLSVGYAAGFKGGQRAGDEWMISLKIL